MIISLQTSSLGGIVHAGHNVSYKPGDTIGTYKCDVVPHIGEWIERNGRVWEVRQVYHRVKSEETGYDSCPTVQLTVILI